MKNLILDRFRALFAPKTSTTNFSHESQLNQLLCYGNFTQKLEKFWASIFYKTWKTSFWTHFCPFWPETLKQYLSNIIFYFNFTTWCCCNFREKLRKFYKSIFHRTWKTSFWILLVLKLQNKSFSKYLAPSHFLS